MQVVCTQKYGLEERENLLDITAHGTVRTVNL